MLCTTPNEPLDTVTIYIVQRFIPALLYTLAHAQCTQYTQHEYTPIQCVGCTVQYTRQSAG